MRNIVYNIFTMCISLFGAWLLSFTNASNAIMVVGLVSTILLILLLYYMKDKVGLSPEKYTAEDLKYSHLINMK